jgi:propanol-preferring alcohol dehydrogenase
MKAYQVVEFGAPIVPNTLAEPKPSGEQVVVTVVSCGLCHSDVHFHEGHISLGGDAKLELRQIGANLPLTLGHEIYGRISAYGAESGLTEKDVGRPVIVYPWIGCGRCEACSAGRDNECPAPQNLGLHRPGGHGEKVIVREPKFLIDAQGMDPNTAGIFACSGLTAYSALAKVPRKQGWTAIIGVGGVGLMALSIAKGIGFRNVVAIDVDDAKLDLAKEHGADLTINSRADGAARTLTESTGGLDGILDFVGADSTVQLALGALRHAGTYVAVGLFGGTLKFPTAVLATRQLTLRGSYVGTLDELRALVEQVRNGHIKPIPVRSAQIANLNEDLSALRSGKIQGRVAHYHTARTHSA